MSRDHIERQRATINELNREISRLINQRTRVALEILDQKAPLGLPLYIPEREEQMLQELRENNSGPLDDETLCRIFTALFEAARRLHAETG